MNTQFRRFVLIVVFATAFVILTISYKKINLPIEPLYSFQNNGNQINTWGELFNTEEKEKKVNRISEAEARQALLDFMNDLNITLVSKVGSAAFSPEMSFSHSSYTPKYVSHFIVNGHSAHVIVFETYPPYCTGEDFNEEKKICRNGDLILAPQHEIIGFEEISRNNLRDVLYKYLDILSFDYDGNEKLKVIEANAAFNGWSAYLSDSINGFPVEFRNYSFDINRDIGLISFRDHYTMNYDHDCEAADPAINEKTAIKLAKKYAVRKGYSFDNHEMRSAELKYIFPTYFSLTTAEFRTRRQGDPVRGCKLAWYVVLENMELPHARHIYIYVDALTGKYLGGDEEM